MNENMAKIAELIEKSDDQDSFTKAGCDQGIFISMAEGRRMWGHREMILRKVRKQA